MKLNLRYLIKLKLTIIFVVIGSTVFGQLSGTKYIPVDYATIASAVTALNSSGVGAGGVTFNIAANYTETISSTISITATGTSGNPVVFQKDPATSGSNPLITAYTGGVGTPGTAIQDGIMRFVGSDYVTIDSIDVRDNPSNTTNPSTMEYGYALYKASTSNGCQFVTIKNCVITLNNINNSLGTAPMVDGSTGIIVMNALPTTATTAVTTIAGGTNSNNKFYTNTIQNCNTGIALIGFVALTPFTLADANNDVGGTSSSTGNTIINYGGGAAAGNPAVAIRTSAQYGLNVSYNTINNNNGSGTNHPNALRGIYINTATSANSTVTYNTITLKGGGTTQAVTGIENAAGSTAAGNTIIISNNLITNCTYSTATTGGFIGILNSATPATLTISTNTISNNSSSATVSGFLYGINNTGAASTVTISSNTFSGNTTAALTTGLFVGIWNAAASASVTINTNTLVGNSTTALSGAYYAIYNTGVVTSALTINSNNIGNGTTGAFTFNAANSGTQVFINSTLVAATAALSISNNNFQGITYAVQGTGANTYILNTAATLSQNISNNTFTNLDLNKTGNVIFISNSVVIPANGSQTISGNSIVTGFNKSGAGGTVTLFTSTASTVASGIAVTHTNNNFSNITLTGATAIAGWVHTDAGVSTKTFTGNTFNNWTTGAAAITGLSVSGFGATSSVSNNTVTNLSGQAAITAITIGANGGASVLNVNSNTVTNLVSSGTGGVVTGLTSTNLSTEVNVNLNSINILSSSVVGTANGVRLVAITISANTTMNINNNVIHSLSVSGTTVPIFNAITVASTGTVTIQDNVIHTINTAGTSGLGYTFNGIATSGAAGNFTISGNTIGSTTTTNSIAIGTDGVTTTGVCTFNGISSAATGANSITNNTIQNCSVYGTGASVFRGINNTGGTGTLDISSNGIRLGTNTGTGVITVLSNTAAVSTANINNNIIRGFSKTAATGTFTVISSTGAITTALNINNNQFGDVNGGLVTYAIANSAAFTGITVTTATGTCALAIKGNDFRGIVHSTQGSSAHTYIINSAATLSQDISNNTFTNLNVNTTGNTIFISNSVVIPANGSQTVSGNSIVTGFNKGGATGTITLFTSTALSPAGGITVNHSNNNFSNLTLTGATTIAGWVHTEASGTSFAAKTFTGNTFNNWTTGASAVTGLSVSGLGETSSVTNNTLTNLNGQAALTAILIGATGSASALNLTNNTIYNLTSSGTGGIVTGLSSTNASTTVNINSNSINNLSSTVVGSSSNVRLTGITVTANTTINVNNNIIHTLVVSGTTTPVFNAITVVSTGTVTIQNNSIHSISTGGTNTLGYTFNGIATSGAAGNFTISNNTIGTAIAYSISVGTNGVTTTGVCTFNGITNAATGTISISNNTVQNASVFGTGASGYTGIANTGAASSVSIASNGITSATNSGAGAAFVRGILISNGTTINVNQNTISSLTGNSITTGSINGLLISGGTTVNAYQNMISSLRGNAFTTLATGSMNGLSITGGTDIYAYRNKIYDLESSSTALIGSVNGIIVSGSTALLNATVRNNIIGDLKVTDASGSDLIRGISVINTGANSNVNVYYNTVYINASSTGTNFGTSGIFHTASITATTSTLDLRNNIIINASTPNGSGLTVAYRRSSGGANRLNNYSSASNNNLFFASTPGATNLIYSDGTSSAQTLEAYQGGIFTAGTIAGRDSLSFTEDMITNLKFVSVTGTDANYLHIDPAKATHAESGAVNIASVTLDFDGDIRQGNGEYTGTGFAPDIGADEFEGICINLLWTGAINTDWNNVANWRGYLPYSEINVIIPTGLSRYPLLSSGPAGITNNLTIQNGASLSVTDNVLQISGSITNNGTFTASNGTIELNGSSAQTIPAVTFSGNVIKDLTINNNAGVTLGGALSLTDVLTVSNGSLAADGYLTLKSTATATARVAPITSGAGTPISGNVIVERYVQGRRKYRLITSSVTTHTNATLTSGQEAYSIWGNWQNGGINTTPNIGNHITGGSSADGFDPGTTNASLYTYNDVTRSFVGYSSANGKNTKYTPLKAGVAYLMFVYGDRLNSVFATNPHNTVLVANGTLKTGDQAYNTGSAIPLTGVTGRFTLLGNPFASPINWATIPKTDLENTYWGWDPNLSSLGGYITVTTTGTVTLQAPYSGSTGLNQYIQPGQGFFVKTSGSSPVITIREQDKVSNFNGNAFRMSRVTNDISLLAINLQYVSAGNKILADGVLAAFDASFSNEAGTEDGTKLANSSAESIAILNDTTSLSIDARQMPQNNDTLFLNVSRLIKSQYTLQIFAQQMESSGVQAYLQDRYLNTLVPLLLSDTNNIVFNVSAGIPASSDINRFRIVFQSSVIALPVTYTSIKATPKNKDIQIDWEVAEESGIQKYEIERSVDGINFNKAGEVTARGNNTSESYQWLDVNPVTVNNYYRVRAIQADGKFFVSKIVVVKMNAGKPGIKVFPNPVKNKQINIRSDEMEKGRYTLLVHNPQGQQIIHRVIDHPGGSFNQIIYVSKMLPAGMYYLKIGNEKEEYNQTIFLE